MSFEWAESKRLSNIEKHGVNFRLVAAIFFSPTIEVDDARERYGELRSVALGRVGTQYFVVVYTLRGETRRLITAWKAGRHERKRYENVLGR